MDEFDTLERHELTFRALDLPSERLEGLWVVSAYKSEDKAALLIETC